MTPELRKRHGVYATPLPLVSFVARAVHVLLQSRFGRQDGLADPCVRLLDPAAGNMSFVIEAWRVALDHVRISAGESGLDVLITKHLLPHFHGIELLPQACAEGRRAVQEFFTQQGFPLDTGQQASLRKADALSSRRVDLSGGIPVILGNPPWSGYATHQGKWICDLLHGYVRPDGSWEEGYYRIDGKRLSERNVKWLQDDYVKFLRLCQWKIDQMGEGIVALVVNHTCLDAPTFRGLRHSLMRVFNEIYALDLHGNWRKGEEAPDGGKDENIFAGVSQGAAVLFLVKDGGYRQRVYRADLYGTREEKLSLLGSSDVGLIQWTEAQSGSPLVCTGAKDDRTYDYGASLSEIFPVHSLGVVTGQDSRTVAISPEELAESAPEKILPFLIRPFDRQFVRYRQDLVARPRRAVMQHLRPGGNVALLALRQSGTLGPAALVTRIIAGHKVLSGYFPNTVFPLIIREGKKRVANLSPAFRRVLADRVGATPSPEDILGYVYAVLHHPAYRAQHRRELQNGFPRIPYPLTEDLFWSLSRLGRKLVRIHLLEDVRGSLRWEGDRAVPLGRSFTYEDGRLRLGDGLLVEGMEPEVWSYRLGGYRVLERWLRTRAGRILTASELLHFGEVAEALHRTIALQRMLAQSDDPEAIAREYHVPERRSVEEAVFSLRSESAITYQSEEAEPGIVRRVAQ